MTTVPMQTFVSAWTMDALVRILGFALYATVTTMGVAFVYRAYSTRPISVGPTVLIGVSCVAVSLNAQSLLETTIIGSTPMLHYATAAYLLGVFALCSVASELGRRVGDHFAVDVYDISRIDATGRAAELVESAGLVVDVDLPEAIDDLDGYRAVDDDVKRSLQGRTFRFPHRLSIDDLEDRITNRIQQDFDVDHVSVTIDDVDGSIERVAVGDRPSGIGASLPPGTVAVAVPAKPPGDASNGDPVEVWATSGDSNRLTATGTFRAKDDDVATVVVNEDDADRFAPSERYDLVTRPDTINDTSELVSAIWDADETVTTVTVGADDELEGEFAGWLPATVLVIDRDDEIIPLPEDNETLEDGDVIYALGTPAELRELASYEPTRDDEATPPEEQPAAD